MSLDAIRHAIKKAPANRVFTKKGWEPVYTAHPKARLVIIGQAPGRKAQDSGVPWNDQSGDNLRAWLGLTRETFYDERVIALVPMDFYFPGTKERGDLPPRPGFAEKWHPMILKEMPSIKLTLLIGSYSQEYYIGDRRKDSLTETVKAFEEYLPEYFPLVHPSPRNNIWQKKNPWFSRRLLPELKKKVRYVLK